MADAPDQAHEYTLSPALQTVVNVARRAPYWDTEQDRMAPDLIPRADAELAVAEGIRRAADIVRNTDVAAEWTSEGALRRVALRHAANVLELRAPADALAEVQRLRDELAERHALHLEQVRITSEWIAERDAALARVEKLRGDAFYIDCEFDGHNGPLLSIAMVREDGCSVHISTDATAEDPWVIENVLPIMGCHQADNDWRKVRLDEVGTVLRGFIGDCQNPVIIADSPVDIGRFCRAISTGEDGGWASTGYPGMTFIVRNVDCYPTTLKGAIRHNAWWDAMALRAALDEDARHG